MKTTARANSNIALIKYWGKKDERLNTPAVGSISLTLDGLHTTTTVVFEQNLENDILVLNGSPASADEAQRVSRFLDLVRAEAGVSWKARVQSENNFPTAAGLASSASGFAALALAGSRAAGLEMSMAKLSLLARRGSGSAARSVFGGFVEMTAGTRPDGSDSLARQLHEKSHWDIRLIVALTSESSKKTGSTQRE